MRTVYELQLGLGVRGFYLLVVGVVAVALVVLRLLERRGHRATARTLAWALFLVALAAVLWATLRPFVPWGTGQSRLILDPVRGIEGWAGSVAWRPVVNNVGLFIPLGALAAAALPRVGRMRLWVGLVALSVGIETVQYLVPSGRVANTADVLANAIGAALGLLLHAVLAPRRGAGPAPPRTSPAWSARPDRAA